MIKREKIKIVCIAFLQLCICCTFINIFTPRYYRLLEKERKIYLGLKAIDSLAATEYLHLESSTERNEYYENFWKEDEGRQEFEERIEYAFRQFGRYAPLSDDRIPTYVNYGPPSRREEITPQRKIAARIEESVKPAEVWTYKKDGLIFDFVRIARAFKKIASSEFGESVAIPHLKEVAVDTAVEMAAPAPLVFNVTTGRFRQKRNLTRLEVYVTLELDDTTDLFISRKIRVLTREDSLVKEKKDVLVPQEGEQGIFVDECNFWLTPEDYRLEIELLDMKNRKAARKTLLVSLIDYQNDAKEISDLVPAQLIDNSFTHEKFSKPVGRVIPLTQTVLPVHSPFYFYAEIYNLETKNGMHRLKTTYEVYNKEKMRKEIVDVMMKDHIEAGDVAYLATIYHPMDLSAGHYIMVLRVEDLLSGKERTAITEFKLASLE